MLKIGYLDKVFAVVGFFGSLIVAWIAFLDSHASDIVSGVVVELFFVGMFLSGYISFRLSKS